jgi:hypothetical protein
VESIVLLLRRQPVPEVGSDQMPAAGLTIDKSAQKAPGQR